MTGHRLPLALRSLGAAGIVLALLAGCANGQSAESGSGAKPIGSATPTSSPQVTPSFVSDGTAEQNLAVFELAGRSAIDGNGFTTGDQLVSSLVAAGFDISSLEITPDKTAAGFTADSIFVSARFGGECLVGQATNADFNAIVAPALSNQKCLVGASNSLG